MTDKVQKIREVIEKRYEYWREKEFKSHSIESEIRMSECQHLLLMVNSLQEESVNGKKCMFTKDNYTDDDRKVLCADCKEKCEYSKKEEFVSEDLEEAVDEYAPDFSNSIASKAAVDAIRDSFKAGAKWKEEQIMTNAIDAHCFGFQGAALFSFRLPADNYLVGSEVKVIVIKED